MKTLHLYILIIYFATLLQACIIPVRIRYYNFHDNNFTKATHKEEKKFLDEKMDYRQLGHCSYDFIKLLQKLSIPNDSTTLKAIVTEFLKVRFKKLKLITITFKRCNYYNEEIENKHREFILLSGEMYWYSEKEKRSLKRYFSTSYETTRNPYVIKVDTYAHLKF